MEIHHSYGKQTFDDHTCFLCGERLDGDGSVEHVFPKWLLKRYVLWDQKVRLLNRTLIPYRQLTIPCCEECNNQHLSRVEDEVSEVVKCGFQEAIKLPTKTWYLWVGKIFYGILRKELSLPLDRKNHHGRTIVTKDILKIFSNLHLFMQGFRGRHKFVGEVPYSVLICNLHELGSSYDFRDNLYLSTVAIKMGEIGIIVSFEDGGLIRESYGKYVEEVGGRKLHPIQFGELYSKVSYQVKLRQCPISYMTQSHVDGGYTATTEMINSQTPLDNWDQQEFIELLRFNVSSWLSDDSQVVFIPPDRVSTWMVNENGEPLLLSKEAWQTPNTYDLN